MILSLKKGKNIALSDSFVSSEFDCPCNKCLKTLIDTDLVHQLQKIRNIIQMPLKITSAYRCSEYQDDLRKRGYETAKGISQHELGKAADITAKCGSQRIAEAAKKIGVTGLGISTRFVHVDTREKAVTWTYKT